MTAAAFDKPLLDYTLPATADYRTKQYFAGKVSSVKIALCSVAGERADGIIYNEENTAGHCQLLTHGIGKAKLGGTVAEGASVMTNASGKFVTATGGAWALGSLLQAGVADDVKALLIRPHFIPQVVYSFFIDMTLIADGDLVTTFTPGFAGTIEAFYWVQEAPVTTAAKASTLNLEIGTTNVTGGTIALTSAACTPLGVKIDSAAITAANTFGATDTISIEAASTTTFIEGSGTMFIETAQRAA